MAAARRPAITFGTCFAAAALFRPFGGPPGLWRYVTVPVIAFSLAAGFVLLAAVTGGQASPGARTIGGIRISQWFATLVTGGLIAFWIAVFSTDGNAAAGGLAALGWGAGVILLWMVRAGRKRESGMGPRD